jgi:hypothetical protein
VTAEGVFHIKRLGESVAGGSNAVLTVICPVDGCTCYQPASEYGPARTVIEVIPGARRLIRSLRDEGYDFLTAAADIIDNSIQAGATEIRMRMEFDGDHSWFQIADDGKGMTGAELTEAMRFGSEREYGPNELGKFGLGLKTASISQCRKLTVASRSASSESEIEIRQLNIDRIESSNRWEIISIPKDDYSDVLWKYLVDHRGTVVMWESLDRMMNYDPPDGMKARNGFVRLTRDLEQHVGMIFHRFLSGELGDERKISISINGTPVEPWDPFARKEKTVKVDEKTTAIVGSYNVFGVHYTAYVLPPKEKFSSPSAFNRTAGPKGWNLQQGFYVYRENRMIQSGGWCRMRVPDEHTKLARIALDLGTDADFSLALNIMKTSITLPQNMKSDLEPMVAKVLKLAREAYRPEKNTPPPGPKTQPGQRSGSGQILPDPRGETAQTISTPTGAGSTEGNKQSGGSESVNENLAASLERAAGKVGETDALRRIRTALIEDNPAAASKIGW